MAYNESGVDGTRQTVGTTSKAGYVELYDSRGNSVSQKPTYTAGMSAKATTFSGTGTFLNINGSATKVIRVQRILVTVTVAIAAVYGDMIVKKVSSAYSGGTPVAITGIPHDPTSAATTATGLNYFTAAPTSGSLVGYVGGIMAFCPITGTPANSVGVFDFDWRNRWEAEAPVLRGVAQGLEVFFGTTTTNTPTITAAITYTEE